MKTVISNTNNTSLSDARYIFNKIIEHYRWKLFSGLSFYHYRKKEKERDYIIETVLPALVEALKPIGDYTEFFNEYLELKKNELFYKV